LTDSQRTDLQRYLDVSRAELLFCTAAILVEGPSEVYLLPALARAMDFDLDAHGVIIANVSGTDFKPYRSLLGASALDVPHVIVTDGDPKTKKGIYRYAGLRRAANLFPEGPEQDALRQEATKLSQLGEQADTWSARRTAMTAGVFVGGDTLEVDIASLLAQQMIDAHSQLETSASLLSQFDGAVEKVALGEGDADDRSELLRRVDHISKGRFAQRLAANVEGDDGAIFEVIAEHYESTVLDESEPFSQRADLDEEELLSLGTYGYLLAALDRISWQVRQHGLISRADVNFIELDEQESA
jgi:putative ATP-dependent endonuclease of OLD family